MKSDVSVEKQDWDHFWSGVGRKAWWDRFLSLYRTQIIARAVNHYINRFFSPEGIFVECGSGTSETTLRTDKKKRKFIALDFSTIVLKKTINNPKIDSCLGGDIFALPFKDNSIDGIWNVGVMEHFTHLQIGEMLKEFRRVLKDDGKVVLFWPMIYSPYEIFINIVEAVVNSFSKKRFQFYPNEISRLTSRREGKDFLMNSCFKDVEFFFNYRDAFSFGIVVGTK